MENKIEKTAETTKTVRVSTYSKDSSAHFDMVRKCKDNTFIATERALIRHAIVVSSGTPVTLEQIHAILYSGTTTEPVKIGEFRANFENGFVVKITSTKTVKTALQDHGFVVGSTNNFIDVRKANF